MTSDDQTYKLKIVIGQKEIPSWYVAPYPEEYQERGVVYVCEFCLTFCKSEFTMQRHNLKCPLFRPPANEIYRSQHQVKKLGSVQLSIFEADGTKSKLYCQNICVLAKAFLDQKTLYYDVDHFLFYILTYNDDVGSHLIGYFSKEKHCPSKNNVSCIMVLPPYQGCGFGRFLIEFSYLLSKKEGALGSPEKPLSDLGRASYLAYWKDAIIATVRDKQLIRLQEIMSSTSMTKEDIEDTLQTCKMIKLDRTKFGASRIQYRKEDRSRLSVKPEDLRWTKYISIYNRKSQSTPEI